MSDPFQVSKSAGGEAVRDALKQAKVIYRGRAHLLAADLRQGGPLALVARPKGPKLGPGEAFHGTDARSARKLQEEGFKLADPRGKPRDNGRTRAYAPRTSRTGRPIAAPQEQGTGVYATKDYETARMYAMQQAGGRGGGARVLRVKHPENLKQYESFVRTQDPHAVPRAVKRGYAGVEVRGPGILGMKAQHDVAIGDPRKVKVLGEAKPSGWTPDPGRIIGTGVATGGTAVAASDIRARRKTKRLAKAYTSDVQRRRALTPEQRKKVDRPQLVGMRVGLPAVVGGTALATAGKRQEMEWRRLHIRAASTQLAAEEAKRVLARGSEAERAKAVQATHLADQLGAFAREAGTKARRWRRYGVRGGASVAAAGGLAAVGGSIASQRRLRRMADAR